MNRETFEKMVITWKTALYAQVLVTVLLLLLGGCIASYSTRHEEPTHEAPDAARVCRYKWSVVEPRGTADISYSDSSKPARLFDQSVASIIKELTAACPDDDVNRVEAQVSVYFLRYTNETARMIAGIPLSFLMGATLGLLPIPASDYFMACLEITAPDGVRRNSIAKGRLDMIANLWGSIGPPNPSGGIGDTRRQDQVLRELTILAWNKAWYSTQAADDRIAGCREVPAAIAWPEEPATVK